MGFLISSSSFIFLYLLHNVKIGASSAPIFTLADIHMGTFIAGSAQR